MRYIVPNVPVIGVPIKGMLDGLDAMLVVGESVFVRELACNHTGTTGGHLLAALGFYAVSEKRLERESTEVGLNILSAGYT